MRRDPGFGPLYVQKPFYPEGEVCHVYLLHPPGGIVGGDCLDLGLTVGPGARALVTTPAATKFYRSSGSTARLTQRLRVAAGGSLEWLPQETLLFGGCRAEIASTVELEPGARFIGWELICLGRGAAGDSFARGAAEVRLDVTRSDGSLPWPLLKERNRFEAGDPALLAPWGLAGRSVSATLVATPVDRDVLGAVRDVHPSLTRTGDERMGMTLLDDVLVVRILGSHSESVRRTLEALWHTLRPYLLQRGACRPRIWNT